MLGILIVFPALSARAQEDSAGVDIRDNYFSPVPIHVPEGGTVTWTDLGGAHSVTSDDNGGTSFDSSPACFAGLNCLANGDTFSQQFTSAGTVTYHCRVHGNAMVGTVIVDAASTTTSTSTSSTTTTTQPTTTSSDASDASASDGASTSQLSQPPLPELPSPPGSRALPRAIARSPHSDDLRPWALLAIAIAAGTTLAGVILVRQGRVPFG